MLLSLEQDRIIESCDKNRTDFSSVQEQMELIREINREFKKQGIHEEARMAFEYVAELRDEDWRNAIEAFLGIHRYAVIVPEETFDVANAVMVSSSFFSNVSCPINLSRHSCISVFNESINLCFSAAPT